MGVVKVLMAVVCKQDLAECQQLLGTASKTEFLAFTAGWGAIGGVIAQYRTVLTAAAMTPWMDRVIVKPYVQPVLERLGKGSEE